MKLTLIVLSFLLLFASPAYGQGGILNDSVLRADGQAAVGATVRVCTEAASGSPCSPTASIFTDKALTIAKTNPIAVDSAGAFTYYASPGFYKEELCLGASCVTRIVLLPADVGNFSATNQNSTRYCDQFAGADMGAKLAGCHTDLPAGGGVMDASGFLGAQSAAAKITFTKDFKLILNPTLSFTVTAGSGITEGILITSASFEIEGNGATIISSKDLATMGSGERYDTIRFDDSVANVTHVRIRGLVIRTTATGTTANTVFVAALRGVITAGNTMKDVLIEGNDVQTVAPSIGLNQKWYGIYLFDNQGVADTTRRLFGARIIGNILDSSDGRNIQVVQGQDVVVSDNILTNIGTGNDFGTNGIRLLGTRNFSVTGNLVHSDSTNTAQGINVSQASGFTGNPASAYAERGSITGNTVINDGAQSAQGFGIQVAAIIDIEISGNTVVATSATPTTGFGIRVFEDVNYPANDVHISGNRIGGWESFQVRVDANMLRTVISGNHLGLTSGGASSFVQDLSTAGQTQYSGYEEGVDRLFVSRGLEVDGDLNHDGTNVGFFGVAPAARPGATDDIKDGLTTLGLLQGTSATPLNLDGGAITATGGTLTSPTLVTPVQLTTNPLEGTLANQPRWVFKLVDHTDMTAAATADTFTLWTFPANTMIHDVVGTVVTAWAGTGPVTAAVCSVGTSAGSANDLALDDDFFATGTKYELHDATANGGKGTLLFDTTDKFAPSMFVAGGVVEIQCDLTGGNHSTTTAGQARIYSLVSQPLANTTVEAN